LVHGVHFLRNSAVNFTESLSGTFAGIAPAPPNCSAVEVPRQRLNASLAFIESAKPKGEVECTLLI
jgi:hypothetical protein